MPEKTTKNEALTKRQFSAIEALLVSSTVQEAAAVAGVNPKTIYRYMKIPEFDAELKRRKRMLVDRAVMQLQQNCKHAAAALAQICQDEDAPASSRVSAAREIIQSSLKALEVEEIEERLKIIEEKLSIN